METRHPPFELVAIVTSAGGLSALTTVLADLPQDVPTAVLVAQHLSGQGSMLVELLQRRVSLPVGWAEDGAALKAGCVVVCPPRLGVEVLPDSTLALGPVPSDERGRPHDRLLFSVAASLGPSALAVVLTGMGRDGADGARALHEAGGTVVAQSEDSAEYPDMPAAAAAGGGVDLVLPLTEIGAVVGELVRGGQLPRTADERAAAAASFNGTDEVSALYRSLDWRHTQLGPVATWAPELRVLVSTALESPVPICILWGPDLVQLYNDAYRVVMGGKHPAGLGQASRACWPEVWEANAPVYAHVLAGGSRRLDGAYRPSTRRGPIEDAWFDLSYSPVRDATGSVRGVLVSAVEVTSRILLGRRVAALAAVAAATADAASQRQALGEALGAVRADGQDIPYAVAWSFDRSGRGQLIGAAGVEPGTTMARHTVPLEASPSAWPLREALDRGEPVLVDQLGLRFRGQRVGDPPAEPSEAVVVPLVDATSATRVVLVLGLSSRLPYDAAYREHIGLVAREVEAAVTRTRLAERERERTERLVQLDRSKIEFFSNVSHEFRTPLTLLLGPLDAIADSAALSGEPARELETARRNARRLVGLVDGLLDFSQLEAGRSRADPVPVDLAELTRDVSELFRHTIEAVGLRLVVSCPPLPHLVWVDPGMWEKIVSNLLTNALKFTFEGEIRVELLSLPQHVELVVSDTGVGIPDDHLASVFQRFHRVPDTRARTHEGAGIGLALVDQLVRLHHGRVRVRSRPGLGTSMTVWVSARRKPLPEQDQGLDPGAHPFPAFAGAQADLAASWVEPQVSLREVVSELLPEAARARVPEARLLVVDDHADLRDYLARLLGRHWPVSVAADGVAALASMEESVPDLVLLDVVMPGMDGSELLARIRAHPDLHTVPVVLLTAHAGEESAVEGLLAGADDYLVKPFSARELVARVGAQLELARLRRQGERRFDALRRASWDATYVMNPDWSEMRALDGRGFIADTDEPSASWLERYIDARDQPRVLAAIDRAVTEEDVFELEHRVRRPDGSLGWTLSRAVPLVDDDGRITEWVGTATALPDRPEVVLASRVELGQGT